MPASMTIVPQASPRRKRKEQGEREERRQRREKIKNLRAHFQCDINHLIPAKHYPNTNEAGKDRANGTLSSLGRKAKHVLAHELSYQLIEALHETMKYFTTAQEMKDCISIAVVARINRSNNPDSQSQELTALDVWDVAIHYEDQRRADGRHKAMEVVKAKLALVNYYEAEGEELQAEAARMEWYEAMAESNPFDAPKDSINTKKRKRSITEPESEQGLKRQRPEGSSEEDRATHSPAPGHISQLHRQGSASSSTSLARSPAASNMSEEHIPTAESGDLMEVSTDANNGSPNDAAIALSTPIRINFSNGAYFDVPHGDMRTLETTIALLGSNSRVERSSPPSLQELRACEGFIPTLATAVATVAAAGGIWYFGWHGRILKMVHQIPGSAKTIYYVGTAASWSQRLSRIWNGLSRNIFVKLLPYAYKASPRLQRFAQYCGAAQPSTFGLPEGRSAFPMTASLESFWL